MSEYDTTLKLLFRQLAPKALRLLTGAEITTWLDQELPKTQNLRLDLLGRDSDDSLHQIELQSQNERFINLRMAEYSLGTYRLTGHFPRQTVLYIGKAPLNMPTELRGEGFLCQYRVIDIRGLDGAELMASENLGDNLIAILTRLRDNGGGARDRRPDRQAPGN